MMRKFESLMEPGEQVKAVADPIFRFLTSLIFIIGGLGHFGRSNEMLARMEESPWRDTINAFGDPIWLLWLSGGVFVAAGITLALGWMTRLSAIALFITLVPITVTIHFAPGHVGHCSRTWRSLARSCRFSLVGQVIMHWTTGLGNEPSTYIFILACFGVYMIGRNWDLAPRLGEECGRVRQGGVISAVAVGHRQAALAVMCRG